MSRYRILVIAMWSSALSVPLPRLTAQTPGANDSGGPVLLGSDLLGLVTNAAVRSELKVTEEQKAGLDALVKSDQERRRRWLDRMGAAPANGDGDRAEGMDRRTSAPAGKSRGSIGTRGGRGSDLTPDEGRRDPFAEMLESRIALGHSTEKSIARILSQEQYKRVRQVQLQVQGPDALLQPFIREKLGLDEDQAAQIRQLLLQRRRALKDARDGRNSPMESIPVAANDRDKQSGRSGGIANPADEKVSHDAGNSMRGNSDREPEAQTQISADRKRVDRIELQFSHALHATVLTRQQSRAYRAMLGRPFVRVRPSNGARVAPDMAGPGANPDVTPEEE